MSGFNGGQKPRVNVAHYIANLNKEPSAYEVARSEAENFNVDDELAQFTNQEFLNFDGDDFLNPDGGLGGFEADSSREIKAEKRKHSAIGETASSGMDFVNGEYRLHQAVNPFDINALPQSQQQQPIFADFASQQAAGLIPPFPTTSPTASNAGYSSYPSQPQHSKPTSASPASPAESSSDPARALAEEDKRRRNTAASARFRVKKKEREQALERKTQELEKANQALSQKIGQLETENEWLRGLVVEKNGGKQKHVPESETESGKKGVGTDA